MCLGQESLAEPISLQAWLRTRSSDLVVHPGHKHVAHAVLLESRPPWLVPSSSGIVLPAIPSGCWTFRLKWFSRVGSLEPARKGFFLNISSLSKRSIFRYNVIFTLRGIFHTRAIWWSFTGVWMAACLGITVTIMFHNFFLVLLQGPCICLSFLSLLFFKNLCSVERWQFSFF